MAEGSRRGRSVSVPQSACLWRSLALELCLVIGRISHLAELVRACRGFLSCVCVLLLGRLGL